MLSNAKLKVATAKQQYTDIKDLMRKSEEEQALAPSLVDPGYADAPRVTRQQVFVARVTLALLFTTGAISDPNRLDEAAGEFFSGLCRTVAESLDPDPRFNISQRRCRRLVKRVYQQLRESHCECSLKAVLSTRDPRVADDMCALLRAGLLKQSRGTSEDRCTVLSLLSLPLAAVAVSGGLMVMGMLGMLKFVVGVPGLLVRFVRFLLT